MTRNSYPFPTNIYSMKGKVEVILKNEMQNTIIFLFS